MREVLEEGKILEKQSQKCQCFKGHCNTRRLKQRLVIKGTEHSQKQLNSSRGRVFQLGIERDDMNVKMFANKPKL